MHFNKRYILLFIVVAAIVVLFLPIKIRFSFETSAKVFPIKEWNLVRGENEGFWSQLYNYETDALSDVKNYRFERGDIEELRMSSNFKTNQLIQVSDTVAFINSFFIENEIDKLKNQVMVERANLEVESTGEKQALVDQAQRKYDYSLELIEQEQRNFNRQQKLFQSKVIPLAEFELAENALKLARINAQIALNELNAVKTGQKSSALTLVEERIKSYEKEIKRLEKQKNLYTIVCPISGIVRYDELTSGIKVSDNSHLILKIPVLYQNSQFLSKISSVEFTTPGELVRIPVTFTGFEENISLIQNQQFVIAKAITTGECNDIYSGMVVKCKIYCDEVTLFTFIKRNFMISI